MMDRWQNRALVKLTNKDLSVKIQLVVILVLLQRSYHILVWWSATVDLSKSKCNKVIVQLVNWANTLEYTHWTT